MEELKKQISAERSQERQEKLSKLVSELCDLNLAIAMAKPKEFAKFHVSKLDEDGLAASQAPPETWKRCLVQSLMFNLHIKEKLGGEICFAQLS